MARLRLLLAGSDQAALAALRPALDSLPGLTLVAEAADLSSTYVLAERTEPDIAILGADLEHLPDFDGLLSVFRLLGTACLRLATESGAGAVAPPLPSLHPGLPAAEIHRRLQAAVAGPRGRAVPIAHQTAPPRDGIGPGAPAARHGGAAAALVPGLRPAAPLPGLASDPPRLILLGASTGGIDALIRILSAFPADCPPTAIVQHTGPAFSASLVRLLGRCCPARIQPAEPGAELRPGTVTLGAGCAGHLRLAPARPFRALVEAGPPISGHLPSVDALFRSALPFAPATTAALLTGMGRDGAQGLLELRRAGALTIAQDAATSVVYGMPRAAAELGAAELTLPLDRIAAVLLAPPAPNASAAPRPPEARAR